MKAVLQRVLESHVEVDGKIVGAIQKGWLILLGVGQGDSHETASALAEKCVLLRGFNDENGKMNKNLLDIGGQALIVSQFTLYGDTSRGRRPSFDNAAPIPVARELYEFFCNEVRRLGIDVQQGIFQADMKVSLINDGPVTLLVEK